MQWKKDPDKKYTDLCIYIDENIPKIAEAGKYPEIENKVFNFLWLILKALAIKKHMFQNFDDYDGYAFYSATRLFFALRRNYQNQGKIIKGKEIRPIKSCLNYAKALMYPMKVEYQRQAYSEVLSEQFQQFDTFEYKERLKIQAAQSQNLTETSAMYLQDSFRSCGSIIDTILSQSPYHSDTLEYKKLKISILLNTLYSIKAKHTLDLDQPTTILWKLPKSMASYTKIILKEFYAALKTEITECCESMQLDDALLEKLVTMPEGEFKDYEE